ncbi:MAG TPA: hypothetical protein VJO52_04540 [Gemmatimonadaceae bacterium]|nr:hypothetical protein [Gemmatimonadaceae bacterium]
MRIVRSLPRSTAFLAALAALAVMACSSDSATAPGTSQNVHILARFDTLANQTPDGLRGQALQHIAQLLAQGAPVSTGAISVNGTAGRWTMISALQVNSIAGVPADSSFTVAAWEGNAPDSVIVLILQGSIVSSVVSAHEGSVAGTGGTASIAVASGGGSCTSFASEAPSDLPLATPTSCTTQRSHVAFASAFGTAPAITVDMPAQAVTGIRLVFDTPAA